MVLRDVRRVAGAPAEEDLLIHEAADDLGPVEFQAYRTSDRSQAEYNAETSYGDNVRAALSDRAEAQTAGAR